MTDATRELITWSLGTMIAVLTLIGLVTKFVLLPYLKEHLIGPVQIVQRQVAENQHVNPTPTLLDLLEDIINEQRSMREEMSNRIDELQAADKTHAAMYEGHIDYSERWTNLVEAELKFIREVINRK